VKTKTISMIFGSIFSLIFAVAFNFNHTHLSLVFAAIALISFMIALFAGLGKNKKAKKEKNKINTQEFTFVDPPGYFTHPKFSYPICPVCLKKTKSISPVSKEGYCVVCKEPISKTLVSGGDAFRVKEPL